MWLKCTISSETSTISNKGYWHFLGGSHPNECIPFPEDTPDGTKKRKKTESLKDEINAKNIKLASETKIETV